MSTQITNKQLEDFENVLLIQKKSPNTIQSYLINIKKSEMKFIKILNYKLNL